MNVSEKMRPYVFYNNDVKGSFVLLFLMAFLMMDPLFVVSVICFYSKCFLDSLFLDL